MSINTEKNFDDFHKKYSVDTDVLLIDDIQFVSDKVTVQIELLKIVDYFIENKKMLVISSNNPLNKIDGIDSRLCARFETGLIADMQR